MRILFSHNIMVEYGCGKNEGRKKTSDRTWVDKALSWHNLPEKIFADCLNDTTVTQARELGKLDHVFCVCSIFNFMYLAKKVFGSDLRMFLLFSW